jgi:hypothetical protein
MAMDFQKLLSQIDSVTSKKSYSDENKGEYWKPTKDKSGTASAIIRFLPNKDQDDFAFVRMWSHSFKNESVTPTRYYIENSLSTIGGIDYISEVNQALWNTGIDENKAICRLQKRKLTYISNIYVIKDVGNPENNGKQFKYKYGQKIFEKIVSAAKPNVELNEVAINAFDVYGGADFLLIMQKANDQYNYDASKFGVVKGLFNGDKDKINEVLENCFDLNLEVSADKFKTPEELKSKFLWVTGQDKQNKEKAPQDDSAEIDELERMISTPAKKEPVKEVKEAKKETTKAPKEAAKASKKVVEEPLDETPEDDGDDEDAAFFKSLVG